eukprot:TRINITY_DN1336_c0_g1_i1.p1 TRINITY_DN1336_c0_g1~~TRINITY_DN1336_c0_g1_i1.p1  ORF type:complete len:238 (-),score=59.63 TRINITY_DN1336_c0_g1_i1:237-950(-)
MAKGAHSKTTKQSRSQRAGVQFPVSRIMKKLRAGDYASRYAQGAPVFLAAVLEYLTAEILELSGNAAHDTKKTRINPRHIQLATRNDEELAKLLQHCIVREGGVLPNIHASLINTKKPHSGGAHTASATVEKPTPKKKKTTGAAAASPKKKAAPSRKSLSEYVWQYEDRGWHNYDDEASDVVEKAYQDYLLNPGACDVRAVKSGQFHYQVDFVNNKQTNVDHNNHTNRNIRRVLRNP